MRYAGQLDSVLQEIRERWDVPGLGVGIVRDGEIVYARGLGVQSLETRAPVTPDSIFCLASIAKPFVATAVMQLVEQGKLHLDAPLVACLPYFRLDDERCRQITIRQMLSHTSGMPDMDEREYDELVAHPEVDEGAPERYVRGLACRKMIAGPGERFVYSNIAYNVLGHLIARVTGHSFETTLRDSVLLPAGMAGSTFFYPDVPRDRLAVPHLRGPQMMVNPVYPYHRADAPASFLHSSVMDMCRWAITSLEQGAGPGRGVLTPASYRSMWAPAASRSADPLYEEAGLGWTLGHVEGIRTVSHGGGGFGWTCFLVLLPERGSGAVILSNEESGAHERVLWAVLDVLLDREPHAGSVSWIVPIGRALAEGGLPAADACVSRLVTADRETYARDADALVSLAYQLMSACRLDLAVGVLELAIRAFPQQRWLDRLLANLEAGSEKGS